MAQVLETPLDERQWRSPIAIQNLNNFHGGLHRGTIHMYFAESDFFDRTSNNWALFMSHNNWTTNRDIFESHLRAMQGLEYMVVAEPERRPDGDDTGVYVVRKQHRRKRPGHDDDITVLATYYIIGEHIYQAGSLEDVVGSKILAATTSLAKFFSIASSLPIYTSGRGYSYFPPSATLKRATTSANQSRRSSRAGSPTPADVSMLDAPDSTQTTGSGSGAAAAQKQKAAAGAGTDAAAAATSIKALRASFDLFSTYEDEFMDTNPLVGEPGAFTFSATSRHVQQMHAKAQADAAAAAATAASATGGSGAGGAGGASGAGVGASGLGGASGVGGAVGGAGFGAAAGKPDSKPATPATSPSLEPTKRPRVKKSKSRAPTAPASPATPAAAGGTPGPGLGAGAGAGVSGVR